MISMIVVMDITFLHTVMLQIAHGVILTLMSETMSSFSKSGTLFFRKSIYLITSHFAYKET